MRNVPSGGSSASTRPPHAHRRYFQDLFIFTESVAKYAAGAHNCAFISELPNRHEELRVVE
ncbi:MAG: hypothetical protein KBH81_05155, partial [Phycisphaerae bacterium]|nr:hypothetical protein [Phycisphaerae bacterium]